MSRETFQSLRMLLMEKLDLARELTDEEILEEIDTLILERMRDSCLSLKEKVQLRQELFHSVRKLDVLQELIEDETVTEIMVNGPDAIFVERAGKLSRWEKTFTSGEKLEDVIQQIVGKCNRVVNESMPIVDARLENGARVNAVVRPVALNGPILTIRRFPDMMVHRLLTKYINGGRSVSEAKYEDLCDHSSNMEQIAANAERASIKYKQVEFMSERLGQIYDGVISGVTEWGLYVELNENKCEGLVPIRDLDDDYYEFDEKNYCLRGRRKNKIYSLGDAITVRVARANLEKKQLDFELIEK